MFKTQAFRFRKAEKIKSDKLAAELKAKADAEAKELARIEAEKKAKIAAEKKAKRLPDKEKLLSLCNQIESFEMPIVSSDEAKEIIKKTKDLFSKVVSFIKTKTEEL